MRRFGSGGLKRLSLLKYITLSVIVSVAVGVSIALFSPVTRSELAFWLLWVTGAGVIFGLIEYALIRKLGRRRK
jgi:hypothetical protein